MTSSKWESPIIRRNGRYASWGHVYLSFHISAEPGPGADVTGFLKIARGLSQLVRRMTRELTSGPQEGSHLSQIDQSSQSMRLATLDSHFNWNRSRSLIPAFSESNASTQMSPRTLQICDKTPSTALLISFSCGVSNASGGQAVCVDAQRFTTGSIHDRSTGSVRLGGMAEASMYGVNRIRTWDLEDRKSVV